MATFTCLACGRECCGCSGCNHAYTNSGRDCCSMCVGYQNAIEAEQQAARTIPGLQEARKQLLSTPVPILRMNSFRPGERR